CSLSSHCASDHRDLHSFPTRRSSDLEANPLPNYLIDHKRGKSARSVRVPSRVTYVRGHADRRVIEGAKRFQVGFELRLARLDSRQLLVAVGAGAAMPRHVLDTSGDASSSKPIKHRTS